ncbi:hypothetical protein P0D88_23230 [Paraburkholderia sp. RL18-103-BIB-C]|jgi:hypothetical protein|uniref:hypothetical protein n=1 Tax=unclassified Paraburkholderia TaxID=2615204 RepID=UPI0038B79DC7
MNEARRRVAAVLSSGLRLWPAACLIGLRHGSVFVALPLCSSLCFFGLRFVLSALSFNS